MAEPGAEAGRPGGAPLQPLYTRTIGVLQEGLLRTPSR